MAARGGGKSERVAPATVTVTQLFEKRFGGVVQLFYRVPACEISAKQKINRDFKHLTGAAKKPVDILL